MDKISDLKGISDGSTNYILAVNETLNVINGKWKMPIMASLFFSKKRYGELEEEFLK